MDTRESHRQLFGCRDDGPALSAPPTASMEVKTVLLDKMKRLLTDEPVVVRECRRCGTSLGTDEDTCPECGSNESALFEIS